MGRSICHSPGISPTEGDLRSKSPAIHRESRRRKEKAFSGGPGPDIELQRVVRIIDFQVLFDRISMFPSNKSRCRTQGCLATGSSHSRQRVRLIDLSVAPRTDLLRCTGPADYKNHYQNPKSPQRARLLWGSPSGLPPGFRPASGLVRNSRRSFRTRPWFCLPRHAGQKPGGTPEKPGVRRFSGGVGVTHHAGRKPGGGAEAPAPQGSRVSFRFVDRRSIETGRKPCPTSERKPSHN